MVFKYLLAQHSILYPTTNRSPVELLMGWRLRTTLDRLHPDYTNEQKPIVAHARTFDIGNAVYAMNFGGEHRWVPGYITEITGPYSYRVTLHDG